MAITYLYRINGGRVKSVSSNGAVAFVDIDPSFEATIDDPSTPDGANLTPVKIFVSPSTIRNATDTEVTAFNTADTVDENLQARNNAKNSLEGNALVTRKVLRSLIDILVSEINALRALHGMSNRTTQQAITAIKNKIDDGEYD